MGQKMPFSVKCSWCLRTFPVRAQMQFESKAIPMLVVLAEVDSVEAAIEQATCQVCLDKSGSTDRGLYEVLKRLGLKGEEDDAPPPREAVVVRQASDAPARIGSAVVVALRSREVAMVDPLMGTSTQVTRLELPARQRGGGQRRNDWRPAQSEPRVPCALREPERREPATKSKPESLTGAIASGKNYEVLEAALENARQRAEETRRERAQKFDNFMFWLKLTLAKIRKRAQTQEVWNLVDTFQRKLGEAVAFDARRRGKKGLLVEMGTSAEELEELCLHCYSPRKRLRVCMLEVVMMDAFEGGRQPESWDVRGGRQPAFYGFGVIRIKCSLPIPNSPLPGGNGDPDPRIVYPQDGQFGPDYTVEHSRRGDRHRFDWERKPFGWAVLSLVSWVGDYPDHEIMDLNLSDLVCSYAEPIVTEEEVEFATPTTDAAVEPTATISPEFPVTT